jgi:capsular exopolysaccharide synthesis family protein
LGKFHEAFLIDEQRRDIKRLTSILKRQDWFALLQRDPRTGILDLTDSSIIKDSGTIERLRDCGLIDADGRLSHEGVEACQYITNARNALGRTEHKNKPKRDKVSKSARPKRQDRVGSEAVYHSNDRLALSKETHDLSVDQSQPTPVTATVEESKICSIDPSVSTDLVVIHKPYAFEAEQFRKLRSAIMFRSEAPVPRLILVTSAAPGEGKSFVAANLAATIAMNLNRHVLLVDSDLRRPAIHRLFNISAEPGLSDHLAERHDLTYMIQRVCLPRMSVVAAGASPPNPVELLTSDRMIRFLDEVKGRYEDRLVVLDSPPAMIAAELNVLAGFSDGIILVVKEGGPKREDVMAVVSQLDPEKMLGIVGNFTNKRTSHYHYNSKYYKNYSQDNKNRLNGIGER